MARRRCCGRARLARRGGAALANAAQRARRRADRAGLCADRQRRAAAAIVRLADGSAARLPHRQRDGDVRARAGARLDLRASRGIDDYLRVGRLFDDVLARVRQQPDVVAAGAAMGLPTGRYSSDGAYSGRRQTRVRRRFPEAADGGIPAGESGLFRDAGIPLVRGRDFTESDIYEQPFVAIISESLARETFPGEDPIGRRIKCGLDQPDVWMTIVGVVGDVRQASPASRPGPELYMPLRQHPYAANEVQVVVRGRQRCRGARGDGAEDRARRRMPKWR